MKRYSIGDMVVYGINGIMEIVDLKVERIAGSEHEYYVLSEPESRTASFVYVPTDNERLVGAMRPLLSRERAQEILDGASEVDALDWCPDNRVRTEKFRKIMESGDHRELIAMIKAINNMAKSRAEIGKKNYLSDDHVMQKAQKLLYSELSLVLGITADELTELIMG